MIFDSVIFLWIYTSEYFVEPEQSEEPIKNFENWFITYNASQKHESTLLHMYVCTERIFDSRSFVYKNVFLKKLLCKLVAHVYMLLLAPFESKLVNQSRRSETFFRKNSKSTSFSFENSDFTVLIYFSKTHCTSNNWPIWTQKVPKEA